MDDPQPFSDPGGKLLPAGLADGLPPEAGHESMLVARLVARFAAQGYALVKPPLVEFEESLLSGIGAALRQHCFRLMDPVSQRMMGVRPDITPQVARIARTRLARAPRPLRLCYAGEVLRVRGTQLRPTRQFEQVGAEVIGASSAAADAEAVVLGAGALEAIGVAGLSVDLCVPTLVPHLAEALGLRPAQVDGLRAALDRKDIAAVEAALAGAEARAIPTFTALLRATGAAGTALAGLGRLDLPPAAAAERDRLAEVVALVRRAMPALTLTIDPVEMRGFEYDSGVSFTFFARGVHGELGRGGRYMAAGAEPSTGFTLFMDAIAPALPPPPAPRRVFLPLDTAQDVGARLRGEGWTTVAGLEKAPDSAAEARRQGCSHCWRDGAAVAV
ncbi:MAG: ATP phosphoribosyltransferase regulatory subunit [Alphaproteobacteria bacterium]|nr:ATP phosphoribosyltransferase regulatory subunit [Alphaproteobacteria bacterium]